MSQKMTIAFFLSAIFLNSIAAQAGEIKTISNTKRVVLAQAFEKACQNQSRIECHIERTDRPLSEYLRGEVTDMANFCLQFYHELWSHSEILDTDGNSTGYVYDVADFAKRLGVSCAFDSVEGLSTALSVRFAR